MHDIIPPSLLALSPQFLGKQIEGVWHTSVVVGNVEHFFGQGVQQAQPGSTPFGQPMHKINIGSTQLDEITRAELLADLAVQYQAASYSLLDHNCNHFSNDFCQLLTGNGIPAIILDQAKELLATPMGQMIMPMMQGAMGGATSTGFQR